MKHLLIIVALAGCAVDPDTELAESELAYCPDGDCEPPPAPVAKPDLVPSWQSACHYIYVNYPRPHYEIGVGIANTGAAASSIHTMRVVFRVPWDNWTSSPHYFQLGALAPGESTGARLEVPCWNAPSCEVKVTADYANANGESNESNNTQTWLCPKR